MLREGRRSERSRSCEKGAPGRAKRKFERVLGREEELGELWHEGVHVDVGEMEWVRWGGSERKGSGRLRIRPEQVKNVIQKGCLEVCGWGC